MPSDVEDMSLSDTVKVENPTQVPLIAMQALQINLTTAQPTLLELPLEIRHNIYSYFLIARLSKTSEFTDKESFKLFDLKPLAICKQTREEAWEYLLSANRWVQVATWPFDVVDEPLTLPCIPMEIPKDLFPKQRMEQLSAKVLFTIRIGKGCGRKKAPSTKPEVRTIYTVSGVQMLLEFCQFLSVGASIYESMSIDLSSRCLQAVPKYVGDLLIHLGLIRGLRRVRFTMAMEDPTLKRLARNMTKNMASPSQWHDIILGLQEEAQYLHTTGFYEDSAMFFQCGEAMINLQRHLMSQLMLAGVDPQEKWRSAFAALQSLTVDLALAYGHSLNERLNMQRSVNGGLPKAAHDPLTEFDHTMKMAWDWLGMSTSQRQTAHHLRGCMYAHMATYIDNDITRSYIRPALASKKALDVSDGTWHWEQAILDFAYAAELETNADSPSSQRLDELKGLLGSRIDIQKPEVSVIDIPGYGKWTGDPRIWKGQDSGLKDYVHMLDQQFSTTSEDDFNSLKEELGIKWREGPPGLLRLLT